MSAASQARRGLELELRRALELPGQPEFVLEYQPLVAVASHRVTGFEALLRWHHPERGLIPPAEFIPVAEEIGLIDPLGELVLARACREAAGWPAPVPVAVNVSALQLRHGGLVAQVARILAESGLDPGRLELEITEGALLRSTERTVAALHRLRAAGVRVALDDFGTGYSSLSHLLAFPFDKIKVDRAFTGQAVTEPNARAIIRAVAGLCAQLGVTMTAEGVETEAQLALLVQEGCQEAQGYLFGRPAPAGAVPGTLARLGHGARPGGAVVALAQAAEA
jgi:EAL domain-containing protein (putative c-di-GMP-specific phosphodiesterase class I)